MVLIIPIFLMATIGYYWLKYNIDQELLRRYTTSLKDVIKIIDENFEQLDSVLNQLAQTVWINKLVNMQGEDFDKNRVNAYDLMEYQQFVYACQQSLPGVSFLGVYFPRKNYVISSRINGTLDFLLHDALSVRSITKEMINEKVAGLKEKETFYFFANEIYQYGKKGGGVLVFKSILKLPGSTSPGAVLISYIPDERFLKAVDVILKSDGFLSLAIKDNDECIFYTGTEKGDRSFSLTMNSSVTGWDYVLVTSKPELLHDIVLMRNIMLLIVIGTLVVCLLISSIFTIRIYRPIRETLALLAVNTIHGGNELKLIKSDIAGLLKQRDELQRTLQEQTPMLLSYYYSQLLLGNRDGYDSAENELNKILVTKYLHYRVCILLQRASSGITLPTKPALLIQSMLDRADSVRVYAINQSNRTLLIARYDLEEDFTSWLNEARDRFPDALIADGCTVDSLKALSDSFADASRICNFRPVRFTNNESQDYYLPFELELDLIIALRTRNRVKSEALVRQILDSNADTKASLDGLYRDLESVLYSVDGDNSPLYYKSGILSEELIFTRIKNICTHPGTSGKRIIDPELLMELVDSSIQNPNISLKYIADRFDVSQSLVSKVLKDSVGEGFSEYINNKRIEMAKGLLSDGYDVISAAKMVGYTNDTTFRRCFRAAIGLSPTEYKQQFPQV